MDVRYREPLPAHDFAVGQLTAPRGELGRIWQIPKAVIYRAIGRRLQAGLVRPESVQPGLGPHIRSMLTAVASSHGLVC